jgi:hypothetical protein
MGIHLMLRRIRSLGPHVTTRTMMILKTYFEKNGPSPYTAALPPLLGA